jgi:fermentation-respiration switch protein FrsA (DUF1100 family)
MSERIMLELARRGRLATAALGLTIVVGCGMSIDRRFLYFPDKVLIATPADYGLAYEDAFFPAADGTRLHGWYVPGRGPITLLWAHGNAGNVSHRLDQLSLFQQHLGVSVFIFDYREYGRSEGTVSEPGTYDDARGALAWLRARPGVDRGRIVYFGESLGSAVVADLAVTEPPAALILEAPFCSVAEMLRYHVPLVPLTFLFQARYDTLSKIGRIHSPLLILHGDRDAVVPVAQGARLFAAANEPKAFHRTAGAGHNDTFLVGVATYVEALRDFLTALARRGPAPS